MKYLLFLLSIFQVALLSQDNITNETNKPMLCVVTYPAVFAQESIHGIKQRVQTKKKDSYTKTLKPNETLYRKRDGNIICYNELAKLSSYNNSSIRTLDSRALKAHMKNHETFDIASYINENRSFIDAKYGISNQCVDYEGGEYCKRVNGLDILYTKADRIKKIFIYGSALYDENGMLVFEENSFTKIRANNEPLGLWISRKNKKIVKSKPSFISKNVIIWENPVIGIKKIVMTPKNGHINLNRYSRNAKNIKVQDYLQAIEIEYLLDDKAYALHQKSRPIPQVMPNSMNNNFQKRNLPQKAKTTWGEYLNPKNKIPTNKFKAFYINTNKPKKLIASQEMKKISINYAYKDFHGIDSKDFGGYWVGNFIYKKEEKVEISVSQSWAKTRIIIDGMVIYEGSNNGHVPYTFSKGKHKIEVEYINNWHTTGFMVTIKAKEKKYTSKELKKELRKYSSKNSEIIFVGTYSSENKDQSITLKIAKSSKPIVLALNSYESVDWIIKNPYKVKIDAIVYSSYSYGGEVKGDISKATKIYLYNGTLGSYSMKRTCSCINGGASFHCDGVSAISTIESVENILGKKMFGFTAKHNSDTLMVPTTVLTKKKKKELSAQLDKLEQQRVECQKKINPEFENIFKK